MKHLLTILSLLAFLSVSANSALYFCLTNICNFITDHEGKHLSKYMDEAYCNVWDYNDTTNPKTILRTSRRF